MIHKVVRRRLTNDISYFRSTLGVSFLMYNLILDLEIKNGSEAKFDGPISAY